MSISVILMDGVDGDSYTMNVSNEEAIRINSDMEFAAEMLRKCKNVTTASEPQNIENDGSDGGVFKWPHEAILLLIEEYRKSAEHLFSGRISLKKVWQNIANELVNNSYNVTRPQCQSKFAGLKRTYKSIKDHNGKSGNGTRTWPYFNLMDGLLGSKPYMTPIATVSSTGKRDQPEPDNSLTTIVASPNPKKPNYISPVDKVIMAINENRKVAEANQEKRHKEKMEQKHEAIDLLKKLVSIMETKKND